MRIHFIAIGGAIMHSLAIELKRNGHIITGSDDVIYDPARANLFKHNILPKKEGWNVNSINVDLDMVIIGMHAKIDNPELLEAQKLNIPLFSFPEYIAHHSRKQKRVVIAGSHGKTTITSMILHVLNKNNIKIDYLLGAKINSIDNLVHFDNNNTILIEGDEYFSSPIDRKSKFMHYQPDVLVVSGVEWDHINVFPSLESYENTFRVLLNNSIEKSTQIFYCGDDSFLSNFLSDDQQKIKAYYLPDYKVEHNQFVLCVKSKDIPLSIFGKHNLYNLQAAKLVCLELGVSETKFYSSIQSFKGAHKRLSLVKETLSDSSIYYDFAHSPSKVHATINALKELYPNRYLIACLQLYTLSSLNLKFIINYKSVFNNADEVWIYVDQQAIKMKNMDIIEESFLTKNIDHQNLIFMNNKNDLELQLKSFKMNNSNLLLMSSGDFSGLNINNMFS